MAITLPNRTYFTFSELILRWQCVENDIRHLILIGVLVPSFRVNENIWPFTWTLDPNDGSQFTNVHEDQNGEQITVWVNDFYYLVEWVERDPFEGECFAISEARFDPESAQAGKCYFIRPSADHETRTFTLTEVMQKGVVMAKELERVERTLSHQKSVVNDEKPLGTGERNMLLTIIGVLAKSAKFDISQASKTADLIVSEAAIADITISRTGVANHLRLARAAMDTKKK